MEVGVLLLIVLGYLMAGIFYSCWRSAKSALKYERKLRQQKEDLASSDSLGKVKSQQLFRITKTDPNIQTAPNAFVNEWFDIWRYKVPANVEILLGKGDMFSGYLEDDTGHEISDTCLVKIEVRDPSQQDRRLIYGPNTYENSREFPETYNIARLDLDPLIILRERDYLVISACADRIINTYESDFQLFCRRILLSEVIKKCDD